VTAKTKELSSGADIPDANCPIIAGRGNPLPIRQEGDGCDVTLVADKDGTHRGPKRYGSGAKRAKPPETRPANRYPVPPGFEKRMQASAGRLLARFVCRVRLSGVFVVS
jgi:hypothetical protein